MFVVSKRDGDVFTPSDFFVFFSVVSCVVKALKPVALLTWSTYLFDIRIALRFFWFEFHL